ncbi:uncharacterized protein LOC143464484 [Clavelina lepadiformis]|uniref:uncharacterized protein LOC143464484 n=1 Tax=Clavelina lepadiformis TaxID=159417 RepID=UPI0040438F52
MVVEVAITNKEPRAELPLPMTNSYNQEALVVPPRNERKKSCCSILLVLLFLGVVAVAIFFGIRSKHYMEQYEELRTHCSGATLRLDLPPYNHDSYYSTTDEDNIQWQEISISLESCLVGELEVEASEDGVIAEAEDLFNPTCVKEQMLKKREYLRRFYQGTR